MQLHTYLNYGGNCEEAFKFYQEHLGGNIIMMMRHGEQPGGETQPDLKGKVLHARLNLGETAILGADVQKERFQPMRSAYLTLSISTIEEADRVHNLLAESGEIFMPMQQTFFASRFSMLRDRFGTSWMILGPAPQPA